MTDELVPKDREVTVSYKALHLFVRRAWTLTQWNDDTYREPHYVYADKVIDSIREIGPIVDLEVPE